jgi:pimeloyl-ACP methyl ester carboxylesterase
MGRATAVLLLGFGWAAAIAARADGPADNRPRDVRPVPPPGIAVPADRRASLEAGLARLDAALAELDRREDARTRGLLPDVGIFSRAVSDALRHGEFFAPADLDRADRLLALGAERAAQLAKGEAPWATATGLVVRGYVSKIDGSVQPYGLVVPESYTARTAGRYRLDVWFHGRGETLSEVNFLDGRLKDRGQFTPPDTIVLHPYGRYCNAFKFAGEVDVLEAIADVQARYRVDEDRVAARGFSMGGAAAWQFAVHYPDRWFAANPGAGFAETPRFLRVFQQETLRPGPIEQTLWNLYDCDKVALNLLNLPTVAYSGEIDRQKQAADVMAEALAAHGIPLTHVIGPGTAHKYHPESAAEVERRLAALAVRGRERTPRSVALQTYTLRYNRSHWLTIDALGRHWERATVRGRQDAASAVALDTENVAALSLRFEPGLAPFTPARPVAVTLDGQRIDTGLAVASDRSWEASFRREGDRWVNGPLPADGLRKRHGLQGPIDDAFMDSFLFVLPGGKPKHEKVAAWTEAESSLAIRRWRTQFRGDAPTRRDADVTDADIASKNLVLWGTPESNSVLARLADRLPVRWEGDAVVVGDRRFEAATHVPALIFPNPLNPSRYVVLNSGSTYRAYDDLNNARQVPKLPDWAILDITTPPDSRWPGKVVAQDFFAEDWTLRAEGR